MNKRIIIPSLFLLWILFIFLFSMWTPSLKAVHRDYIYPVEDAKVWKIIPDNNYGTDPLSTVGNMSYSMANDESFPIFKFDFSDFDPDLDVGEEVQISSFSLELFCFEYYSWRNEIPHNYFILSYSTNQTWDEEIVTWNNHPSMTETPEVVDVRYNYIYHEWDCSEINEIILEALTYNDNFTLGLSFGTYQSKGAVFCMREYGGVSNDPRFVIEYEIVSPEEGEDQPIYEREINLSNFPYMLGEKLHIGLFGGQMLASTVIIFMFMLPIAVVQRGKGNELPYLIVGIPLLGLLVVLGWLPVWIMFIICFVVALLMSGKIRGWVSGIRG